MCFFWALAICTFDFIWGRTGRNSLGLGCLEVREGRGGVSEGWGRYAVFEEEDVRDVMSVGKIVLLMQSWGKKKCVRCHVRVQV